MDLSIKQLMTTAIKTIKAIKTHTNSIKTQKNMAAITQSQFMCLMEKLESIERMLNGSEFPSVSKSTKSTKTKKTKKTKDPNAPKRPNTAHCLFLKSMIPVINAKYGEGSEERNTLANGKEFNYKTIMSVPEVMAEWKEGSSERVVNAKETHATLRAEWETKMASYSPSDPVEAVQSSDDEEEAPKKQRGRPKKKIVAGNAAAALKKKILAQKKAAAEQKRKEAELKKIEEEKKLAEQAAAIEDSEDNEEAMSCEPFEYNGEIELLHGVTLLKNTNGNEILNEEGELIGYLNDNGEIDLADGDELEEDDFDDDDF